MTATTFVTTALGRTPFSATSLSGATFAMMAVQLGPFVGTKDQSPTGLAVGRHGWMQG